MRKKIGRNFSDPIFSTILTLPLIDCEYSVFLYRRSKNSSICLLLNRELNITGHKKPPAST